MTLKLRPLTLLLLPSLVPAWSVMANEAEIEKIMPNYGIAFQDAQVVQLSGNSVKTNKRGANLRSSTSDCSSASFVPVLTPPCEVSYIVTFAPLLFVFTELPLTCTTCASWNAIP